MMAKATTNGNLKFFLLTMATVVGLFVTLGKLVWDASGQAKDIESNCTRVTAVEEEVDIVRFEVDTNSDHVLVSDLKHNHLVEKIDNVGTKVVEVEGRLSDIETSQQNILNAVKALKK